MDVLRCLKIISIFLMCVLLSYQTAPDNATSFECPLLNVSNTIDNKTVYNIMRSENCKNGRQMDGCCVDRFYCVFNSSNIDLSMYGPPGFRMPCREVCCPYRFILPIPLYSEETPDDSDKNGDDENDVSGDDDNDDDDDKDDDNGDGN